MSTIVRVKGILPPGHGVCMSDNWYWDCRQVNVERNPMIHDAGVLLWKAEVGKDTGT